MASDEHLTEMLEVPGYFRKPHQIFISEKPDWSVENNALEETDPLCFEVQDCESTTEGEEQPPLWLPVKADLIVKEETMELVDPSVPPSELTVKQDKVPAQSDVTKRDTIEVFDPSLPLSELTMKQIEERHSTTDATQTVGPVDCFVVEAEIFPDLQHSHSAFGCGDQSRKRIPFSQIISTAIMNSPNRMLSLREIYQYVNRKFPNVKVRGNWQSSIRHTLSVSPHFVKKQRTKYGKGQYWALEASFLTTLEKHFTKAYQCCCQWQLVCRQLRLRKWGTVPADTPARRQRTNSLYSLKDKLTYRSAFRDGSRAKNLLANDLKKLPGPANDSETDTGDEFDSGEEVAIPGPPLKPLIAKAIMLSPYRHVPLSVIYTYCIRHCSYYRDNQRLCQRTIKKILTQEACFKRLPQENSRPEYWTFDMRYKDIVENDIADTAPSDPWEHDHGGYHKRLPSVPDEASDAGGQLTEASAQLGPDTEGAVNTPLWQRLHGSATDSEHSREGDTADSESENRFSPKRPHLLPVTSSPLSDYPFPVRPIDVRDVVDIKKEPDYPFPVRPIDVRDVVDIKEEPFPEEFPAESICNKEKGEQRQKMCTALPDAECYGAVKIKQEKEENPITVKYEMVDTQC